MRKTKLGKELYETALWKVTNSVCDAINIDCWYIAREANYEGRGIAYALWNAGQITDEELDKVVHQYWINHELIERHFASIKK